MSEVHPEQLTPLSDEDPKDFGSTPVEVLSPDPGPARGRFLT
jgi:hypothetical protein